jgi:23S rRNA pseudouridine1911/1915/1917 synthase
MNRWKIETPIRLIDFLSINLGTSKKKAKELLDQKLVFVKGKRIWMAHHLLQPKDMVEIHSPLPEKKPISKSSIIYEDNWILAVNKPPFILTNESAASLEGALKKLRELNSIQAIHRLDKDTSGVILYAKSASAFEAYKQLWQGKSVEKIYLAISSGGAAFENLNIQKKIEEKNALTHVKLINKKNGFSYFEISIETGRKHQIRIHLASIRHPILGDKEYGKTQPKSDFMKQIPRQMLHAWKIKFICPFTNEKREITANLPEDFRLVLNRLELC